MARERPGPPQRPAPESMSSLPLDVQEYFYQLQTYLYDVENRVSQAIKDISGIAGGDMEAATYDPNTVAGDAFDMDNMVEGTNKILTAAERSAIAANTVSSASTATTSGTNVDFTSLPSGLTEIEIAFADVSQDGGSNYLIRLSTGAAFVTTGYVSGAADAGCYTITNTTGYIIYNRGAANSISGIIRLTKHATTNQWIASHTIFVGNARTSIGGGQITLGGQVDGVRLTSVSGGTFDAGNITIRYK